VTESPFEGGSDPPQAESRGMIRQGVGLIMVFPNLSPILKRGLKLLQNESGTITQIINNRTFSA